MSAWLGYAMMVDARMEISVFIEEGLEGCPEPAWLEDLARKVLGALAADATVELSLAIVGQETIHRLNLSYLGVDEPTDVLAFSMLPEQATGGLAPFVGPPDGVRHLGDVVISCPQAAIQAEEHRHSREKEMAILIIHGVLHLLGYDHDIPEREYLMRAREIEILSAFEGKLG